MTAETLNLTSVLKRKVKVDGRRPKKSEVYCRSQTAMQALKGDEIKSLGKLSLH